MPTSVYVRLQGLDAMIDAMREVQHPSFVTTGKLESVLDLAFAETQARVHIISTRLKLSGVTETDFNGKVWEGTITYGGISRFDSKKAYYAQYEMARSGSHDFFSNLHEFDGAFEDAIDNHFRALK